MKHRKHGNAINAKEPMEHMYIHAAKSPNQVILASILYMIKLEYTVVANVIICGKKKNTNMHSNNSSIIVFTCLFKKHLKKTKIAKKSPFFYAITPTIVSSLFFTKIVKCAFCAYYTFILCIINRSK